MMNVNPFSNPYSGREPEFDWKPIIEVTPVLTEILPYLEGEIEPDESSVRVVEMLQKATDDYCNTLKDKSELAKIFPDMVPAAAALYLVSSDYRTVFTREIVKTNPTFVSRVLANDAAMKIIGGSDVNYFKQRDPGMSFTGSPKTLADVGRVTMLTDILQFDDPHASIPVITRALDAHTDQLANAAIEAYGDTGSWIKQYSNSLLLRQGLFRDGIKEAIMRDAIANATNPLLTNLEPSNEAGARSLEFAIGGFEHSRFLTLRQLGSLSLSLNSN